MAEQSDEQGMSDAASGDESTPQFQRKAYKALGYKMQKVGETWYCISKKWFKSWQEYTQYLKQDEDVDGGVENLHLRDCPVPEGIDNTELLDPELPGQLSKELQEHLTHEWVHEEQWELLVKWYGGGPAIPRKICERGGQYSKEKYINMYPLMVRLCFADDEGKYDIGTAEPKSYPQEATLRQIQEELQKEEEKSEVHLWAPFKVIRAYFPLTSKRADLKAEDFDEVEPERYVEIPDDYMVSKVDDLDEMKSDTVLVVEKKTKDGKWPMSVPEDRLTDLKIGEIIDGKDEQKKWYEAVVRYVGKDDTDHANQYCMHFIGWKAKWDEWVDNDGARVALRGTNTKGPYRPRTSNYSSGGGYYGGGGYSRYSRDYNDTGSPEQQGVVGLRNLGNTCFMNSTIQCIAQSPYLTEYFLEDHFVHHVNRQNPLGWKGKVAEAWAQLLKDIFSNKYRTIAPRAFKSAIGEVAPRFMGYAQQDSQELLSFLLDGLHEDLNQIINKPVTEQVESDGRPDDVVAAHAWKTYLKRNQSIIVDLMQGQYKSRVECPDCDRVSVTFDPYMFLSVPLPTERYKVVTFTFVAADTSQPPTVYGIKMLKMGDMDMLKKAIAKQFNVPRDELYVCDVWRSKIHRVLKNRDMVQDINPRNDDIFVYHVPKFPLPEEPKEEADGDEKQKDKAPPLKAYPVICQARVKVKQSYGFTSRTREEDQPIGVPLIVSLPVDRPVTQRMASERVFELLKPYLIGDKFSLDGKLPFAFYYTYGIKGLIKMEEPEAELPLDERNFKFHLHFADLKAYKQDLYPLDKRPRDESAPPPVDKSSYSYGRGDRGSGKPVDLSECVDAFTEEEILDEHDMWYCNKCQNFKKAKKKLDIWSSPDLLVIHLKRFSYTRQWRDRINTLVRFPLEGLDMSRYLVEPEHQANSIYDLYAISNHYGGLGGGHYTAYAKNLYNSKWYNLDDSSTSPVANPESIVTSAAYVLYYVRRKARGVKHRASRVVLPGLERQLSGGVPNYKPDQ